MPIRDCVVVAVEGTHASGKTTLVHALTSHLRQHSINAECTGEPARYSPFIEEIVVHNRGGFDLTTELDLFAAQITTQLRASRHHSVLVTDKTIANVVAYARLLLPGTHTAALDAMAGLCRAVAGMYDAVFYCSDTFNPRQAGDRFRDKVADQQNDVDQALRKMCAEVAIPLIDVPPGMDTARRVAWISAKLTEKGLLQTLV
jgi:thymidylate kinase